MRKVVEHYLECGRLHQGFARIRCGDCSDEKLLAKPLLHEVTAVTTGRRFSLVSFLDGERESEQRKSFYHGILLGNQVAARARPTHA